MSDAGECNTSLGSRGRRDDVAEVRTAVLISSAGDPTVKDTEPQSKQSAPSIKAWMLTAPIDFIFLSLPGLVSPSHIRAIVCLALLCLSLLYSGGRYRARLHVSVLDELPGLLGRALIAAAVVSCVAALRHPSVTVTELLRLAAVSAVLLVVGRCLTSSIIRQARRRRLVQHPTVLIGAGPLGVEIARILECHPQYGLHIVGYVDDRLSIGESSAAGGGPGVVRGLLRLGRTDDLDQVVRRANADVILVADPSRPDGGLLDLVRGPAAAACDLLVVPRLHEFHTQVGVVDHIGAIPIMRIRTPRLRGPAQVLKRLVDIVLGSVGLLVLAPVLLGVAIAVRLEDGGPVLFRQPRMTRDGRIFEVLKFRSMVAADAGESATTWSIASDPRVGRVGRFIRRTSIDELPQLYNIVRGDMTLVGPRPERPHFVERFSAEHPGYANRHRVVCGLTGLAQVSGLRGDTPISDRARFDNFYIENWSLWLDVKVLLRTINEILGGRGR
jgi:exopolysaccharide biosynthesis polyprenyl glycosylphosphotransferase